MRGGRERKKGRYKGWGESLGEGEHGKNENIKKGRIREEILNRGKEKNRRASEMET